MGVSNRDASVNRRTEGRYFFKDRRVWRFKLAGKGIPTKWIHNLSPHGFQVRYRKYQCYEVGEVIPLEVYHRGRLLLAIHGVVRWKRECPFSMNMFTLGLEFIDPHKNVAKLWYTLGLTEDLQVDNPSLHIDLDLLHIEDSKEANKPARFNYSAAIVAACLSFLVGYIGALGSALIKGALWAEGFQLLLTQVF